MTTATTARDQAVWFCSFCGKVQDDVKKLIAGPGVFICDECVGLCVAIMDLEGQPVEPPTLPRDEGSKAAGDASASDERVRLPNMQELSDEELMRRMVRVAQSREQVDSAVGSFVRRLRERGVTWARIGEALGMTRQSAWERYSDEE